MLRRLAHYQQRMVARAPAAAAMGVADGLRRCLPRRSSHHAAGYHDDAGDEKNRSPDSSGSANIPAKSHSPPDTNRLNASDRIKILQNTKPSRQHLTPQLTLHLITEECTIYHKPIDESFCFAADPFWGFYWPGGQALTRFILDNRRLFTGKSVLDVGCGCGASSIAALLSGASFVTANDIDTVALQATLLNAELNIVELRRLEVDETNQIGAPCDRYNVILIGDLFYDAAIADVLMPWLNRLAIAGKDIYIGDPGRHGLTETRLRNMIHLARYELPPNVCLENNGFSHANVWKFVVNDGESERMS